MPPAATLFLSDNTKEVDAAKKAGMCSLVVFRPGNAALSDEEKGRLTVVNSFAQVADSM